MNETNAAIRGCKKGGATEIVAIDGHGAGGGWAFNSWIHDRMEPGAEYITGYRWGSYIEGLKAGIDAVLLPGAHAMAGTADGVLCHTISSTNWVSASINAKPVGESGLVAAIAGSFNVPVIFVSGDKSTCREVVDLLGPDVVQACVKIGLGRFSARNLAHADACNLIEEKVHEALVNKDKWPKPYNVGAAELKIELHTPDQSVQYVGRPGIEVVDSRTVVSRANNFWQAWDQFWRRD
jgi:D-amino peptidase